MKSNRNRIFILALGATTMKDIERTHHPFQELEKQVRELEKQVQYLHGKTDALERMLSDIHTRQMPFVTLPSLPQQPFVPTTPIPYEPFKYPPMCGMVITCLEIPGLQVIN